MPNTAKLGIEITVDDKGLIKIKDLGPLAEKSGDQASKGINKASSALTGFKSIADEVGEAVRSLGPMIATYLGAQAVSGVMGLADEMLNLSGRINMVTDSSDEYNAVSKLIYQQSQETGTQLQANISSFSGLAIGMKDLGIAGSEVLGITDAVTKSLIASNSSREQATSFQLQFTQAMQSGVVQGDEFRAMMESNSVFSQALAAALGTTIAGLRGMSREGQLTAEVIRKAIPEMAESITTAFEKVPKTMKRGMTEISNAFAQIISEGNQVSAGTEGIADRLSGLAGVVEQNAPAIQAMFSGIVTGAEIGLKAVSALEGTFKAVASGALAVSSGIYDTIGSFSALSDAIGLTNNAGDEWKVNAQAARDAALDLAYQSNDAFERMKGGIEKNTEAEAKYKAELEKNLAVIEADKAAQGDRVNATVSGIAKMSAAEEKARQEREKNITSMWKTLGVGADEYFEQEAQKILAQAEKWAAAGAGVLELEQYKYEQINALSEEAWAAEEAGAGKYLDGLTAGFTAAVDNISEDITGLNDIEVDIPIDADTSPVEQGIQYTDSEMSRIDSETATVAIDGDIAGLEDAVSAAQSSIDSLSGGVITVDTTSVESLQQMIDTLKETPTLSFDAAGDIEKYKEKISEIHELERAEEEEAAAARSVQLAELKSERLDDAVEVKEAEIAYQEELIEKRLAAEEEVLSARLAAAEEAAAQADTLLSAYRQMAGDTDGLVDITYFKAESDALTRQAQEWQDAGIDNSRIMQWMQDEMSDLAAKAAEAGVSGLEAYNDALVDSYHETGNFSDSAAQADEEIESLKAQLEELKDTSPDDLMSGQISQLEGLKDAAEAAKEAVSDAKDALSSSESRTESIQSGESSSSGYDPFKGMFSSLFSRSYAGGGYTGSGPRSGGVDGQGGFPAILHPNETVVDHSGGDAYSSSSSQVNNTYNNAVTINVSQPMTSGQVVDIAEKQRIYNKRNIS